MRICLYTTTALPKIGGHEIAVDALARQFQDQGHEVVVLAPHPRLPLRARDRELPYPVVRHPRLYSTRRLVDFYAWWLTRLHRRSRFDVVHCQGVYPHGYLATLSRRKLGVPVVLTSQGDDVVGDNHRMRCPLIHGRIRQAVQHADHLFAISSFTMEGYLRLGAEPDRITLVPNGSDVERLSQPASRPADLPLSIKEGQYLLFLGRLAPRKGVDVLLEALALTSRKGGVDLVIAGDGEERPALQELARKLGIDDRVCFTGAVQGSKKVYLLQNAISLVVPSRRWEGAPLVIPEAFAAGLPVVGSHLSGMTDLIRPGETGWLVPPEAPAALAGILQSVVADPTLKKMRHHVRIIAKQYSWSSISRRQIEVFENLIAHPRIMSVSA